MRAAMVAALALGLVALAGCGPAAGSGATTGRAPAANPGPTSCGITLCDSNAHAPPTTGAPSQSCGITVCLATTSLPPRPITAGPWVDVTANLAGLASECGNLSYVSARADQDMVIAGVALQGLWAEVNGATMWMKLGQGKGSAVIRNRTSSITYDPSDPNRFWESGLYNEGGAYETNDNGTTFRQLGNLTHSDFVSVDLRDPARSTMLSGRHETSNVYQSTNGGTTWVDISSALPAGIGYTTSPLVINSQQFLLGTSQVLSAGIFRTVDGGKTWVRVYLAGVAGPALVDTSDGAIYWLLDNGQGLIRSTNRGATWQTVLGPGQVAKSSTSLLELPDGRLTTFGNTIIVSADHGDTWQAVGPPLPFTPTGITYSANRQAFYAWRFDCDLSGDNSVKAGAIMRLSFNAKSSP